jgi:hypothetical protein
MEWKKEISSSSSSKLQLLQREREREAWMDHGGVQWMAENGKTQQGGFRPGNNPGVRRRAENGNNTVLD